MIILPQYASIHEKIFIAKIYIQEHITGFSLSHHFSFSPKNVTRHYALIKGKMTAYTPDGPQYLDGNGHDAIKIPMDNTFNFRADIHPGSCIVLIINGEYEYIYKVISYLSRNDIQNREDCSDCIKSMECLIHPPAECCKKIETRSMAATT